MKLQLKYEAPVGIVRVHEAFNAVLEQAVDISMKVAESIWRQVACTMIERHPNFPRGFTVEVGDGFIAVNGPEGSGAPMYSRASIKT